MKKNLLLVALVLFSTSMFAQKLFTSVGLNLNSNRQEDFTAMITLQDSKRLDFYIEPRIGYFITKNFIAGVKFGYRRYGETAELPYQYKFRVNETYAGLFLRYTHKFNDFIGVSAELSSYRVFGKGKLNDDDYLKEKGGNTKLVPGLIVFAGKHLSFEFSYGMLRYMYQQTDYLNRNSTTTMRSSADFDFNLNPSYSTLSVNYAF